MKGLTLLEVLVSVTIVAIIMATIYGAYTSNVETIQNARWSSEIHQTARIVLDRMGKDMASAYMGEVLTGRKVGLGMVCKNREIDGRPADRIDFTSLAHLTTAEGGLQTDLTEIGYHLEEDPENGGFILYRRDAGIVDDDIHSGGRPRELGRMVTGLDMVFQNGLGEEFEEWNTFEGEGKGTFPALIRISLTLKDQGGRELTFITSIHPEMGELRQE